MEYFPYLKFIRNHEYSIYASSSYRYHLTFWYILKIIILHATEGVNDLDDLHIFIWSSHDPNQWCSWTFSVLYKKNTNGMNKFFFFSVYFRKFSALILFRAKWISEISGNELINILIFFWLDAYYWSVIVVTVLQ